MSDKSAPVTFTRQAAELDYAFGRNGWTPDDVKWLSTGDILARILEVRRGDAEIKPVEFWRTLDDLGIQIPGLKHPTLKELRKQFSWIESIERDTSPVEAVTLRLGTVLRPNEDYVPGLEYERRLAPRQNFTLGYQQAVWLVEHQDEFPALRELPGKIYIDFPGLVVVSAGGHRYFPCLSRHDGRWRLFWHWTSFSLLHHGRVAGK